MDGIVLLSMDSPEGEASPVCYYSNADMSNRKEIPGKKSFHRVTTSLYGRSAGIEQSFKQALHRSNPYLSWSPNHIDRDRVTANRDEEKVSSVTID